MQSIRKIYFIEADSHTTKVKLSGLEKYTHFYSQHRSIRRTFPPFQNVLTSFPFDSRTLALAPCPTHLVSLDAGLIFLPKHSCKYYTTYTLCFWLILQSMSMYDVPVTVYTEILFLFSLFSFIQQYSIFNTNCLAIHLLKISSMGWGNYELSC